MPRHLTSDAHEWINEIPTVPIYYLANLQPRERAWKNQQTDKQTEMQKKYTHTKSATNIITFPKILSAGLSSKNIFCRLSRSL